MSIKPILMNTDMTRALLAGRKTMTRRMVKLKYSNTHLEMRTDKYGTRLIELQNEEPGVTSIKNPDGTTTHTLLAAREVHVPYRPGDILYVRETWRVWRAHRYEANADIEFKAGGYSRVCFANGGTDSIDRDDYDRFVEKWYPNGRWRPSIHMPRAAARIFLRVTDVRAERLQEIAEEQAQAEGFRSGLINRPSSARTCFCELWDSTVKPADREKYGWAANPWVWVIAFERCERLGE